MPYPFMKSKNNITAWRTSSKAASQTRSLVLGVILSLGLSPMAFPAACAASGLKIENERFVVQLDSTSGSFSVVEKNSQQAFITNGYWLAGMVEARTCDVERKSFGQGQAIEVVSPFGQTQRIMLFPGVSFVLFQSQITNASDVAITVPRIRPLRLPLGLGKKPEQLRALGTAGLTHPAEHSGSYAFLSLADPETRHGVVAGWVTHDRGSGVLFSGVEDRTVYLEGQIDYGKLVIDPHSAIESEILAAGYFDDARLGLESYADTIAQVYQIKLHPKPAGYCTWYHKPYGRASDEQHIAETANFASTNLAPFGFQLVQIDDGWQEGKQRHGPAKNFYTHKPGGPYPGGMKAVADNIKAQGLMPGIWFMPFAGDHEDPFFQEHPEWFVKTADGRPFTTPWGGTSLDMTQEGAREYVRSVAHRIAHEWGYQYFKLDGLWMGTATRQMYVNDAYRPDSMGEAIFKNPRKTNIEAYRDGLKLVREAAGNKVFLLGCCIPQNMRSFGGAFGLVDAMRIGPDNGSAWADLLCGPTYGSRTYFLNGRVWHNDPDPIYVRPEMPLKHAQLLASWVTISGQMNLSSEWMPALPPDRVNILKRTMPFHDLLPRPVDLFDSAIPRIWLLTENRHQPRRDVIALYNWDEKKAVTIEQSMEKIGLRSNLTYVAFDYWGNKPLPPIKENLTVSVAAGSCLILAVRVQVDRPQLISTSRHITQGMVDVLEERWDEAKQTLSGVSRVVGGDPYELRVIAGTADRGWRVLSAKAFSQDQSSGLKIETKQDQGCIRAVVESGVSRNVSWEIAFEKK